MSNTLNILEKSKSIEILIALHDKDKLFLSELLVKIDTKDTNTINRRIESLRDAGLINEKGEAKFGGRRYIWLTGKGKKIAKHLIEIKKNL